MSNLFHYFSEVVAKAVGSSWAFLLAVAVVGVWAATGPAFGYSDTWQLLINTGTTVVTFLMVFIILNDDLRHIGRELESRRGRQASSTSTKPA